MGTTLFIIDCQNDFIQQKGAALPVPGSHDDMVNLSEIVYSKGDRINKVVITLDQHQFHHIAHPMMWMDKRGRRPKPFTRITFEEVVEGKWRASLPENEQLQSDYVHDAELAGGNLTIWPSHCVVGTWGASLCRMLQQDLQNWSSAHRPIRIFTKSHNWTTEQYSSFRALVPRDNDPTTQFNKDLWHEIQDDLILVGGQALSHCVKDTILDALDWVPEVNLASRMVLLSDCTSPVAGFNVQAEQFLHDFTLRGGRVMTSHDALPLDDC